jgi:FixJ family two-component response regulator
VSFHKKRLHGPGGRTPVIAVVDDDESVRLAVQRLVRAAGMDAVEYASGEDLIDTFRRGGALGVDCIVLDLHMLGMNGFQVAESLTQSGVRIPFVFMSGADDDGVRALGGPPDLQWIRKPFDDAVLLPAIEARLFAS